METDTMSVILGAEFAYSKDRVNAYGKTMVKHLPLAIAYAKFK